MNFFEYMASYIKTNGSGTSVGSAADDGFYLKWDGSTEGRDVFDTNVGVSYYKVSNAILTAEQVNGAELLGINGEETCVAAEIDGGVIALGRGEPFVFSGLAGSYSIPFGTELVEFVCPSNGTYFLFYPGIGHVEYLRKEATT